MYHICSKHIPTAANPLALLVVTYLVAAAVAFLAFWATSQGDSFVSQLKSITWAPIGLGLCVVGLEISFIMLYRLGWNISLASLVTSVTVSMVLLFVGLLIYKEHLDVNKFIGVALCVVGLVFISKQ
ncbi:MAG: EamA family transporter [Clostridiales bacterium]|nr:EamA family transporter [Clostridiales bacterium]